eukprot:TRINITY_DN775991_c0_g1_i1.p1 TRINITY_DN775991_c0_g1~~TRINITY_DN775991_c0_g1_i1.p1  ORF type:complete len:599 (+),score=185.57 TRINITY_DN775991_c0_g1_i1:93-1889(+)
MDFRRFSIKHLESGQIFSMDDLDGYDLQQWKEISSSLKRPQPLEQMYDDTELEMMSELTISEEEREESYSIAELTAEQLFPPNTRVVMAIPDHKIERDTKQKHFTQFSIHVHRADISLSWRVDRRYKEFRNLNDRLRRIGYQCPSVPPRKVLGSVDAQFLAKRRKLLEEYLQELVRPRGMWSPVLAAPELREFLTAGAEEIQPEEEDTAPKKKKETMPRKPKGSLKLKRKAPPIMKSKKLSRVALEDFELLKVIGKGSFGKVVLVRQKQNGEVYAMKMLNKSVVFEKKQVEHTKTERRILGCTDHPFVVRMHYAFQSKSKLYFVLDYCAGGELFFHLGRLGKFREDLACFYTAELALALSHLHAMGVVYRDLKPENVLLDDKGHIRLADFGLSKQGIKDSTRGTKSFCGTPEYLAPEILERKGHGTAVDWWSLGMLLYEMLTGLPPWYVENTKKLFHRILNDPLTFPAHVSPVARDLLKGWLTKDPSKRLGAEGIEEIKTHPFFSRIDWNLLLERKLQPPFAPATPVGSQDTSNFDVEFTNLPVMSVDDRGMMMGQSVQTHAKSSDVFAGFTYQGPSEMEELAKCIEEHSDGEENDLY